MAEAIAQFKDITNATDEDARAFLQQAGGDLQVCWLSSGFRFALTLTR